VLQRAFQTFHLNPIYAQLSTTPAGTPGYVVKLSTSEVSNNPHVQAELCAEIESGLKSNSAYRYARDIGQLRQLQLELVNESEANEISMRETIERISTGQRLGDIKPTSLFRMPSLK
jgi:hypothetical protein